MNSYTFEAEISSVIVLQRALDLAGYSDARCSYIAGVVTVSGSMTEAQALACVEQAAPGSLCSVKYAKSAEIHGKTHELAVAGVSVQLPGGEVGPFAVSWESEKMLTVHAVNAEAGRYDGAYPYLLETSGDPALVSSAAEIVMCLEAVIARGVYLVGGVQNGDGSYGEAALRGQVEQAQTVAEVEAIVDTRS